MRRFEGKVVVVTGSGRERGLGQAILQRFADEGAACVVSDLGVPREPVAVDDIGTTEEMQRVAAELRSRGADAIALTCDVTDDAEVGGLIDSTVAEFGRLDVLVNNAGIGTVMKPFLETSLEEWLAVMNVNLTGAFLATKHAARAMIARGEGGRVINIASHAAKMGIPHMSPYCSSKHGLIGLTRSNAIELGPHGITVNAVCPSHMATPLGEKQGEYLGRLMGMDGNGDGSGAGNGARDGNGAGTANSAWEAVLASRSPLGRAGQVGDTAAACAWLASDDAKYVTGEALSVSGGEGVMAMPVMGAVMGGSAGYV